MKRKTALSTKSFACFAFMLLVNMVTLAYAIHEPYAKFSPTGTYFILGSIVVDIGLIVGYYYAIIAPYRRIKNLYIMFLDGYAYEELFTEKDYLTPELSLVMERFYSLLNKQDAISVSKKQAEYLALQNQINPHFLYNTLEAIRGDALFAGMLNISEIAEALSSFFRYTITDVGNLVTLEDELENVENYFKIQQYRFGEKFKILINLPDSEENIPQLHLPKLTLQPIIENAIFHGLERKSEGGTIQINVETTKMNLFINIVDDGFGINADLLEQINTSLEHVAVSYVNESKKRAGGIALRNVNTRIKLLFGDEYGVHIYSTKGIGTDVRLTLPKVFNK